MAYGIIKVDTIIFDQGGADQNATVSGIYRAITSGVTVSGTIAGAVLIGTTTVAGTTVTGTTANFASGVFTTQVSGATVTGTQSSFTSGNFVTLSGATATFTSGVIASGTAAAPALSIVGDLNTGIYSPGADQVAVATNGVARVVVNNTGLGVGIPPSRSIDVYRGDAGQAILRLSDVDSRNVELRSPDGTGNQGSIGTVSNHDFIGLTGNTERLRITSAGLVGVGTSNPDASYRATIAGSRSAVAPGIFFSDTDASPNNYSLYIDGTKNFVIRDSTNSLNRITVTPAGLVGIGTSSPADKLHVVTSGGKSAILIGDTAADTYSQVLMYGGSTKYNWSIGAQFNVDNALEITPSTATEGTSFTTPVAVFTQAGRVGIGTTGPVTKLDVRSGVITAGSVDATNGAEILRGYYSNGATVVIGSEYSSGGTVIGYAVKPSTSTSDAFLSSASGALTRGAYTIAGNIHKWYIGGNQTVTENSSVTMSEVMRIDTSGRLLVGTSTSLGNGIAQFRANTDSSTGEGIVILAKGDTATAGQSLGQIKFTNSTGNQAAFITGEADTGWGGAGSSDYPGRLVFSTTPDGGSSPTERMRILNNGTMDLRAATDVFNVLSDAAAGTTNLLIRGGNTATSFTAYNIPFGVYTNGNVVNTNNSYGALSDIKLKENIVDATSQWSDIKALQVRKYNFKEGQTHTQIGLVAQEVELVSPGLVSESPDRDAEGNDLGTVTKSVNYSVLYMKAVKALQEAMERIETLEARLTALESA